MANERPASITSPLGPDALLLSSFSGREAISQLFSYQLELVATNDRQVPFDALLGQPLTLSFAGGRSFNGIVGRFAQGARGSKYTAYRAEVVPSFWLLTFRTTSRIFQQKSVPDILRQVLGDLNPDFKLQGTFEPRDYCVQYRESDFEFASRLMEEEGIYYCFEHASDGHRLVLADSRAGHSDAGALTFDASPDKKGATPSVFMWEKEQGHRAGKVTLWDHNFELPHNKLEGQARILGSVQVGSVSHRLALLNGDKYELYDYPGGYAKKFDGVDPGGGSRPGELQKLFPEAQRQAALRMEEETVPAVQVRGAATARNLVAGQKFTLQRHFSGDGPYVLTGVTHAAQANVESGELTYSNQFTCIPEGLPFRPPRTTPRPVVGPQTAYVVGPPGQSVFADKYGRVKVQFHWDREGRNDDKSSCWVRVAQPPTGGSVLIPRIGQEVVVDFLEGDPDRPIILGTVSNPQNPPPTPTPQ